MNTQGAIVVWGDLRTRKHWQDSLKVMAKGLSLAAVVQAPLWMVLIGAAADREPDAVIDPTTCMNMDEAAGQGVGHGAQTVHCFEHPDLAVPRTDTYAPVLTDFVQAQRPSLILLPNNDFGRETAAICAQRCSAGLIADCTELMVDNNRIIGRCPAWGGQILADITLAPTWPTSFVTVCLHGAAPDMVPEPSGTIEKHPLDRVVLPPGLELKSRTLKNTADRRLQSAERVVVGGAGVGDMQGFDLVRELAAALDAEVGATRPAVMNHWAADDRLIGQTGKTVRPRLLISVGTSGAIQYTAGIAEAETVVAINTDAKAPIFQWADMGIVGDARTLLPQLTQKALGANMRQLADAACSIPPSGDTTGAGFGALVRRLRKARNWRREDLAEKTGQTPDFIAQVETDRLSPPVSFILGMAQAFQVDPSTFLGREAQTAIRDRRVQAYDQRTREYSYTTLTPGAQNCHLRAFMVTIEAKKNHRPVAYKHDGEEFIYVMEGDLALTLDTEVHILKPGESIRFNSDVAHKLKSASRRKTRCLVVLYTV